MSHRDRVRNSSIRNAVRAGLEPLEARSLLSVSIAPIGVYESGLYNEGGSEIVAYDPETARAFAVNAEASSVDVLDMREPSSPMKLFSIDISPLGAPNSVAVSRNTVAVAVQNHNPQLPGKVAFYKTNGQLINAVTVGALPDMLTFTPDGNYLLVANEGEPNSYGQPDSVDPEGSISIIPIPRGIGNVGKLKDADVRTASFTSFNTQKDSLIAQGVRIYGPGATVAQDLEPEYIAVTPNSRTAYVSLQENNALAIVDIASAMVTEIVPLGYKDYSKIVTSIKEYNFENLPSIGSTAAGQDLTLGGFSGLFFEGRMAGGNLKFITHTDRGPNGEPTGQIRPFLLPEFAPRLVRFELNPSTGSITITQQILLADKDGAMLTGLPNTRIAGGNANTPHNDEIGVDLFGAELDVDPLGGDFEGIAVDADGSFWMCDEYRPAIYHFDPSGRLIERYVPAGTAAAAGLPEGTFGKEVLPAELAQRRQNRGFEAIAIQGGKVYAMVQSPIRNPSSLGNSTLNASRNVRLVELDPATEAVREFVYIMDNPAPAGADDTRADKIGDMAALPNGDFLVIERDDDKISTDALASITKRVYRFSLAGATNVTGIGMINGKTVDQMTTAEFKAAGIAPINKSLHIDLAEAGYNTVEKVEGLAIVDVNTIAVLNDNDFGVAGIEIDQANGTYTLLPGYTPEVPVLGLISMHNGLDASDRDGAINIRNWPVFGMYQPDSIAVHVVGGETFIVTANEGDARDYTGFAEEARVSSLKLDPVAFPDATSLKQNASLGRLNVTSQLGDIDGDGDFDALYTLGGRSFSIFRPDGTLVYDSGNDFEVITAKLLPEYFNAGNTNNTPEDRSDNKGPEPEALAIGQVNGRTYAFIGLERIGGVMVYDITDPRAVQFVQYVNRRDFTQDVKSAAAGDLGPEGFFFISADKSPNDSPLLLVGNEVSGTTTVFQISGDGQVASSLPHLAHSAASTQSLFSSKPIEGRKKDLIELLA